jgi:prepilin-type N-terminal cleavage/methylation domain-containing protein
MINKGFTVIELMIAVFMASLIMLAVYGSANISQRTSSRIEERVIAQEDVRGALDIMALEIRMASYNPSLDNTVWVDPTNCNPLYPNNGTITTVPPYSYKGIQAAGPNSITIEMYINANNNDIYNGSSSPPITNNPNGVITYNYDSVNLRITRATNCGAALSFLGDTIASGNPINVQVINDLNGDNIYERGTDVPLFRYFDYQNNEICISSATCLPAEIPNIRAIEISIAVATGKIDPITYLRKTLIYSTRVIPRNHVANQ